MLAMNEQYLKGVGGSRTWLKGMVGLAGPYDFLPLTAPDLRDMFGPPEEFEKSQPIFYVDGNNPPLFLLHGEDDDQVWVKNTRNLAKAVKDAGGPVETVIYKEMSHRIIIGSLGPLLKGRSDVFENVVSFIKRVAEQAPATGPSGVQGQALKSEEPGVAPQPLGDAPTDAPRAIPPQP